MSETKLPFALAPMVHPDGIMMDGTPLATTIARLDSDPAARPWHYMLGCLYPTHATTALESLFRSAPQLAHRVIGLKANGSPLPPESLDGSVVLETTEPKQFARDLWECARNFELHVLRGMLRNRRRSYRSDRTSRVALPFNFDVGLARNRT